MKSRLTLLTLLIAVSVHGQIVLEHEFFMSDPLYNGNIQTIHLTPDEVVYTTRGGGNIYLFDLDYNLFQTIPIAPQNYQYIEYISRELFDCDPDNIEYLVRSGTWGNTLIEIYREDGTLLESIPYGLFDFPVNSIANVLPYNIQSTPDGTKMFVRIMEGGQESMRIYGLCGDLPVPCCSFTGEPGGISGIPGGTTFRYSTASPNPTANETTVRLHAPLNEPGVMRLFNQQGQAVKSVPLSSGQFEIHLNLGELPAGTYLYRIETESGVKPTGKVVKI
ncbi:MAG: T9SS C-terminal target domain-containing protein [Cryomorphaceae bacterium]|nr:MAG: T9SS C-terminal target domain-containing protein [Cryomorphaceae bacterium]